MGSILQTTLNTRALPTGDMRYVRSDYPGKLTDEEVQWLLQNGITTIVDLREGIYHEHSLHPTPPIASLRKRGAY